MKEFTRPNPSTKAVEGEQRDRGRAGAGGSTSLKRIVVTQRAFLRLLGLRFSPS